MRKIIYSINLSADGCCDHSKFNPDEQTLEFFTDLLRQGDTFLYGRKTYELMVPYWPDIAKNPTGQTKDDIEFAQTFVSVKQIVVFSRTLEKVEDEKTRIVRTNLKDEIIKLKQEPGKDILLGGVDLPSQLMELDLIDEYLFVIHPVIVGEGRRLSEGVNLQEKLRLKLVDSKIFKGGGIALRYVRN